MADHFCKVYEYRDGWHGSTSIQPRMRGAKKLRAQRRATRNP